MTEIRRSECTLPNRSTNKDAGVVPSEVAREVAGRGLAGGVRKNATSSQVWVGPTCAMLASYRPTTAVDGPGSVRRGDAVLSVRPGCFDTERT